MESKHERILNYLEWLSQNYKQDFIDLWLRCCDMCDWLESDFINKDILADIIIDYDLSFFDDQIKEILAS